MDAVWHLANSGGPVAWAFVGAASLALLAGLCALIVRRLRKLATVVAVALAMGTVGIGALAGDPDDSTRRVERAIADVEAGELDGGCTALGAALRDDWTLEQSVEGTRVAIEACVDGAIAEALAETEPLARERALLVVAAADAPLTPSKEQFQRVAREVAEVPGAETDGKGRLSVRSYEIRGSLPTDVIRAHTRDQLIRLRGCHAEAWQQRRGMDGSITLKLAIDPNGRITRVAADGIEARFHACIEAAFVNAELGASAASSRVVIVLDLERA